MKCNEFLRHLGPMLDSECDPETHLAVSQHLQSCKSCAERLSREKSLEDRLKQALINPQESDEEMWNRLEKSIASPKTFRFSWIAAAAAAVLVIAIAYAFYPSQIVSYDLAQVAYADHVKWRREEHRQTLVPGTWQQIGTVLHGDLPFDIRLTQPIPDGMELAGVRACTIGQTRVALLIGDYQGKPLSLFIFPESELPSFPKARDAMKSHQGEFQCRQEEIRILARCRNGKVVCAAGEVDHSKLEALTSSVLSRLELSIP